MLFPRRLFNMYEADLLEAFVTDCNQKYDFIVRYLTNISNIDKHQLEDNGSS